MYFSPYAIMLLLISLFLLILYTYLWPRRSLRGVRPLSWIFISIAFWCISTAFSYSVTLMKFKVMWASIAFAGVAPVPLLFLLFVVEYCGYERHFQYRFLNIVWIIPAVSLFAVISNHWHAMFWSGFSQNRNTVVFDYGPLFWFFLVYVFFMIVTAVTLLIRTSMRMTGILRAQLLVLLMSTLFVIVSVILKIIKLYPFNEMDLSALAVFVSLILLSFDILRFHLLDIIPVAYNLIFDYMQSGILILDRMNRVIDCNTAMAGFIGRRAPAGCRLKEIPEVCSEISEVCDKNIPFEKEIYNERFQKHFEVRMTPLKDGMGRILILTDVTARKKSEIELQITRL